MLSLPAPFFPFSLSEMCDPIRFKCFGLHFAQVVTWTSQRASGRALEIYEKKYKHVRSIRVAQTDYPDERNGDGRGSENRRGRRTRTHARRLLAGNGLILYIQMK